MTGRGPWIPRRSTALVALAALLSAACAHRASLAGAGEPAAVQQRERGFLAALGARHLEQTVAYFADDAVLHVANMPPVQGRAAIADLYGVVFRFLRASDAAPERVHVSRSADLAYTAGRVSNVFAGERGTTEYAGKYLLVWEKRAGAWMIVFYSVSNDHAEARR